MRFSPLTLRVLAAEAVEGANPSSGTTPGAGGMRSTAPARWGKDGGALDGGGLDSGGRDAGPASKV